MDEVTFDGISECYDASREVPVEVVQQLVGCLEEVGVFQERQILVDVACGTGRYLKPFASVFTHAIGLDISKEMIDIAKRKCETLGSVRFVLDDARSMSIATAAADVVISSKLFLHVREWKKIVVEIRRITREGGYFIYITETGLFNNEVRKKFREQCIQGSMQFGFLGEVDLEKMGQWIEETGYRRVRIPDRYLGWEHKIRFRDAYEALRNRAFVEFQKINDNEYQNNLDSTAEWISNQPNGWDEIQEMKPRLRVDVFRKTENVV